MNKTVLNALWTRIGQVFANKAEVSSGLLGKQDTLTPGTGIEISNGVISSTFGSSEEVAQIVVTSLVSGVDVEDLDIDVYYNGSSTVSTTVTTDEYGMAALRVPLGYQYKLVFPVITGCVQIPPAIHTASVGQRSIEVEYVAESSVGENVTVVATKRNSSTGGIQPYSGITVTVRIDGSDQTYTTNSAGNVQFVVPYGKSYQVTAENQTGWYVRGGNSKTITASQTNRTITFVYNGYQSGIFIVDTSGNEYTFLEWQTAVEAGTVQNQNAKLIKVSTAALASNGGVFGIDIDNLRERNYGSNLQWCPNNVLFQSIPENGNSTSANYYYDGYTASVLIQTEGDERTYQTPAVDACLALSVTVGSQTLPGFLGSVGQWAQLWNNCTEVDDILTYTRPNGTYLLSTFTSNKWTSTQSSANYAAYWTNSANGSLGKSYSVVVVPFFAF